MAKSHFRLPCPGGEPKPEKIMVLSCMRKRNDVGKMKHIYIEEKTFDTIDFKEYPIDNRRI